MAAAAETRSYARAARVLATLSEIEISSRQINRMTDEVGRELCEQQQRVKRHEQKTLKVEVTNPPDLAVVETDGSRIRTRQSACGSGTHHPGWKESKTALIMRMASETHDDDPADELPASLQNRRHVGQLVQDMAGAAAPADANGVEEDTAEQTDSDSNYESPQCLPVTSTLMESLIKEMNYREKGTEDFWNNPDGANNILAVKAAALSEDERLTPTR